VIYFAWTENGERQMRRHTKQMRNTRHRKYSILGVLLSGSLLFQGSLSAFAAETGENPINDTSVIEETVEAGGEITPAAEYIEDMDTAKETLNAIIEERGVTALVYLCDTYEIKAEADPESATVYEVTSGQSVQLLDVDEDSGQNIWFRVLYESDSKQIQGYIERDHLAYSDERVIDWESQNVSSRTRRRARVYNARASYPDVASFPESYQEGLTALKSQHPNWIFVRMDTGLDWNTVIAAESEFGRNLIHASTAIDVWKNGMYSTTWANASPGIIKYYMDPRNFLTESGIFQFEQLTYNESYHTLAAIQAILDGTFMSGLVEGTNVTYAGTFLSIGQTNKVSPFLLASRVRQEQGASGTSPLISGTYPGYEGLYNYYNIGASGTSDAQVVQTGLERARKEGWTSRTSSLVGGSKFLVSSYVFQGQDTLYLQKFDVDNKYNGLYWHQYMQNVQAPASEAQSTYRAYQNCGVINQAFVFKIPVYNNMPSSVCGKPSSIDSVTLNTDAISNLPVGETAVLTAYINGNQAAGTVLTFTSSNEAVATVDENGVVTGVLPGTTTISCTKENATTAVCTVTVIKADTVSYTIPVLNEITYDPSVTLNRIALPTGFRWENGDIVPTVENSGYNALYTPDSTKYNEVTLTIPLKVKKAEPSYSVPAGLQGAYGTELSSVSLPAGFAWEAPGTVLNALGTVTYTASYNPDVFNYNSATGISITVNIVCTNHRYGEWNMIKDASCTETGTKERICTVCGSKESGEEAVLGHNMVNGVCDRCGILESESNNGGQTGTPGNDADSGNTGNTGNAGNTGDTNNSGNAENPGDSGNAGNPGNSGNAENPGDSGNSGNTGNPGDTDHSGSQGDSNDTGNTSNTGNIGASGTDNPETGHAPVVDNSVNSNTNNTGTTGDAASNNSTAADHTTTANNNAAVNNSTQSNNSNGTNSSAIPNNTAASNNNAEANNSAAANNSTANNDSAGTNSNTTGNDSTTANNNTTGNNSTTANNNMAGNNSTTANNNTAGNGGTTANNNATANNGAAVDHNITSNNGAGAGSGNKTGSSIAGNDQTQKTTSNANTQQPENGQPEQQTEQEEKIHKVDMTVTSVVPSELFGMMQEKNVDLELEMGNGITWLIHGNSMEQIPEDEIDMGVELGTTVIPEEILQKTAAGQDTIGLTLLHEGEFGFDADLMLSLDKKYSGMIANLFYYDPAMEQLEFITDAQINEEGMAGFTFTHASEYVIIISETSMRDGIPEQSVMEVPANHSTAGPSEVAIKTFRDNTSFSALTWQKVLVSGVIFMAAMIGAVCIFYGYRRGRFFAGKEDLGEDRSDDTDWFDEESGDDYRDPAKTE